MLYVTLILLNDEYVNFIDWNWNKEIQLEPEGK